MQVRRVVHCRARRAGERDVYRVRSKATEAAVIKANTNRGYWRKVNKWRADEKFFRASGVHRREQRTWPVRYVVKDSHVGWNECALCKREHRVWMTNDDTWRMLPRALRRLRLCVRCFRREANG